MTSGFGCQQYIRDTIYDISYRLNTVNDSKIGKELVKRLEIDALAGNLCAEESLATWTFDGARRKVNRVLKDDDTMKAKVSQTGAVVSVPTRVAVRERAITGQPDGTYQLRLWFEVEWDEFEKYVERFFANLVSNTSRYNVLRDIMKLRGKHPQTLTPEEACKIEGIDPRDFELPPDLRKI